MIIDKLENISLYRGINENLDIALDYIKSTSLAALTPDTYGILSDDVYAIVKECQTRKINGREEVLEGHLRYVDVHYVVKGREQIGYATLQDQMPVKTYDTEADFALYKSAYEVLTLEEGVFAIFFPDDIHLPEVTLGEVSDLKKVVVKVRI